MQISKSLLSGLVLGFVVVTNPAFADEEHEGKALHDESCFTCHRGDHDAAFYNKTLKKKRFNDFKGLHTMVEACDSRMGTAIFPEDMELISDYLNETYYKFKRKKRSSSED